MQIAKILRRRSGAKADIARRAGVGPTLVSHWLKGRATSQNVAFHAEAVAREILAQEDVAKHAAGDVNGPSARRVIDLLRKKDPEA